MSDHYYSKQPQSKETSSNIMCTLKNHTFTFTTGAGVFSKKGIDFGSRLLIESFQPPDQKGDFLDLGCGYGPIGISIAHFYRERHLYLVDINERAIALAKRNAQQNDVGNVTVMQSDGFEQVQNHIFAAIVTNPPIRAGKQVIQCFFESSRTHLIEGGELWVVVQKKQGAPSVIKFLSTIFNQVDIIERKKGYHIIRAIR